MEGHVEGRQHERERTKGGGGTEEAGRDGLDAHGRALRAQLFAHKDGEVHRVERAAREAHEAGAERRLARSRAVSGQRPAASGQRAGQSRDLAG